MHKNTPFPASRIETRWPVILTIIAATILVSAIKNSIEIVPDWFRFTVAAITIAAITAVPLSGARASARRIERVVIVSLTAVVEAIVLYGLFNLIGEMMHSARNVSGLQLLASSVVVWVVNILMFSLLYWQIDQGGPEARINTSGGKPDWLFPQTGVPEYVPHGWKPIFIDYLFLAFTAAVAFSPTDTLPLKSRAKLLMMFESVVSLMTIVVVISRAINILGNS